MLTPPTTDEPAPHATKRPWYRRPLPLAGLATAVAVAAVAAFGIPLAAAAATATTSSSTVAAAPGSPARGPGSSATSPYGSSRYGSGSTGTVAEATAADADESTGVVLIDTVLGYQDAAAAGTGMILTDDGLVLTNNHVIEGATEITVTIAATRRTYAAAVVGTDVEDDVALLQLDGASGLTAVAIDDDGTAVGDAVTAVGNAEGGGVLMAADGSITALAATVTTASEGTVAGETLDGMIQIAADVVSGDSGGALLDDEGEVIGMTTAASSGAGSTTAYAIPIDDALAIVTQILDGDESDGVSLGYPAFLGVGISPTTVSTSSGLGRPGAGSRSGSAMAGATITGVYDGTPAAAAGLAAGDVITAVDGTTVTGSSDLAAVLAGHDPGDTVAVTWTDTTGASHTATVTLAAGPAA